MKRYYLDIGNGTPFGAQVAVDLLPSEHRFLKSVLDTLSDQGVDAYLSEERGDCFCRWLRDRGPDGHVPHCYPLVKRKPVTRDA